MKSIGDFFPTGSWLGKRAWVIGGGPSAGRFRDWMLMPGDVTIAVNLSYRLVSDPTIHYVGDSRLMEALDGKLESPIFAREWHLERSGAKGSNWIKVPTRNDLWGSNWSEGAIESGNSGLTAINIADILGAEKILLLGFDGGIDNRGKMPSIHEDYPDEWRKPGLLLMRKFGQGFKKIPGGVRSRITNIGGKSQYRDFSW